MADWGVGENPIPTGPQYGLSHSALKARPAWVRDQEEFRAFVAAKTAGMPDAFGDELRRQWGRRRADDAQAAARWGFGMLQTLRAAEGLGIVSGDGDHDLRRKAEREARLMAGMLDAVAVRVRKMEEKRQAQRGVCRMPDWLARLITRAQCWVVRLDLRRRGVEERMPKGRYNTPAGIVFRARDPVFWRRILRRMHAKLLEGSAINLGLVHAGRRGGCYVSSDSLKRRRGQRLGNAAALQATVAMNDRGESDNLANIAAKGMANGEVRRAELMTRISGFEVIANDVGHRATFITVTCPSRMHKWRRGAIIDTPNPSYDGTLPDEAQAYLAKQWGRFRSAAARAGLSFYGFRIAEPHHDGCPHWHILLWHGSTVETTKGRGVHRRKRTGDASIALGLLLAKYFLANESPDEPGADQYRIKVEAIDPAKGSAVAYVAKYVAKNIDGYRVGADLYGNPALESSARVEAWASTWRIRQFQQIGGAPVGVWRELRRLHPGNVPMEAADELHDAVMMVNVAAVDAIMGGPESEADEAHRIRRGWAAYNMAQGGPMAPRRARTLRVLRDQDGQANRYGELGAPRVVGVSAVSRESVRYGIVVQDVIRIDEVESERAAWVTASVSEEGGSRERVVQRLKAVMAERQAQVNASRAARVLRRHVKRREAFARGEAVRPWTRVNNCTRSLVDIFGAQVYRTKKRGEVFRWGGKPPDKGP